MFGNRLTLTFSGNSNTSINIFNQLGTVVRSFNITDSSVETFDLSDLAAGIYYINVIGNGNVKTKKIVKY
jgi:hypothetical protein